MRPKTKDYNSYYDKYINLIENDNIISVLKAQKNSSLKLLSTQSKADGNYSYADGKWTVKELLGHLIDTERIMAYRALCIARNEKQPQPGFEQDDYVAESNVNTRTLQELFNEFRFVRESNIILFNSFNDNVLNRKGIVSDNEITVLALIFIIAGHEKHHMKILQERYLNK